MDPYAKTAPPPTKTKEPRARGPSPEKTAQTRSAIVGAAFSELLEKGFANTTMDAVAKRAGVAKGTPYRYFLTKEALFEGVVREKIAGILDVDPANRSAGESVEAFLRRTILVAVHDIERKGRAAIARLVLAEGGRFPALVEIYRREMLDPLLAQIKVLATAARADGELVNDRLIEYPDLLIAPIWYGIIYNGLLDRDHPLEIGALFEAQLDLIFQRR
jgi:TetR/AcrR family transcriptional regulator, regulator of autoinduction and epiphytic fitness